MTELPVALVCPTCRGEMELEDGGYRCEACRTDYPVVAGIPDLRVSPDPWIGFQDDRDKAERLLQRSRDLPFEDTVRAYWDMTPGTPRELADRFTDHVLRARERSAEWLDGLDPSTDAAGPSVWLDIGCGTADLAAAAADAPVTVVGIDIALRWLVAARKRLHEEGLPAHLVCANAERLPFPDDSFSSALSLGTLEHCPDKGAVLDEARRTLRSGGTLHLRTVNRFSLLPEAHVGLWGVGFLPRRWAEAYVEWRGGQPYEHHPVGATRLRRALEAAGFREVEVMAAPALAAETERMGRVGRTMVPAYEATRELPAVGSAVRAVAPLLEARGRVP